MSRRFVGNAEGRTTAQRRTSQVRTGPVGVRPEVLLRSANVSGVTTFDVDVRYWASADIRLSAVERDHDPGRQHTTDSGHESEYRTIGPEVDAPAHVSG